MADPQIINMRHVVARMPGVEPESPIETPFPKFRVAEGPGEISIP